METEETTSRTCKRYTIMNFCNISLIQNKILQILVFCNSAYFVRISTSPIFLDCAPSILFSMKAHSIDFFCFSSFSSAPQLISFVSSFCFEFCFSILDFYHILSIKFDPLICVHRRALSSHLYFYLLTRRRPWSLTNPIWHSTTLCLHWDQLLRNCTFICSNVPYWLVCLVQRLLVVLLLVDWVLWHNKPLSCCHPVSVLWPK